MLKIKSKRKRANFNRTPKVVLAGCRESYPRWVSCLLLAALLLTLLFVSVGYHLRYRAFVGMGALALVFVGLWHKDSNGTLRERLPPAGWKAKITPDRLELLTLEEFNSMRFELNGADDDDIENHRVRWASRYSRDKIFLSWIMALLAPLCLVGAFVVPHVTVQGSAAELPHSYNLVWAWIVAALLLLVASLLMRLDWKYSRLLLDQGTLYLLKENPAWLPWTPGKNDVILVTSIWSADPVDQRWGKYWNHGTVILTYLKGYGAPRQKILRRVPWHRDFCNIVNSVAADNGGMARGMM
jgi:hypothetical protein